MFIEILVNNVYIKNILHEIPTPTKYPKRSKFL